MQGWRRSTRRGWPPAGLRPSASRRSGTTPFVRAALSRAQTIGATGRVSSRAPIPPRVLVETCDVLVLPKVGPEALTGSTRMKAGTATKLVLNTLSTGAMIRLGRAYGKPHGGPHGDERQVAGPAESAS